MDWLEASLLGLVQGLTEFLPVSSSGHLVMAERLLGIHTEGVLFEVVVHVGTLLAVMAFYRKRLLALLRGILAGGADAWRYVGKLAVTVVPGAVAALTARDFLERLFDRPAVTGGALIATGAILWTTRSTLDRAHREEPSWTDAFVIGCAQVLAIVPGLSRSGTTVAVALALGVSPLAAAEFSFLMSLPALGGAALLQLPDAQAASGELQGALLAGGAMAALSGVAALWLFLRVLKERSFHQFAWYTWTAGAAFLFWLWQNPAL